MPVVLVGAVAFGFLAVSCSADGEPGPVSAGIGPSQRDVDALASTSTSEPPSADGSTTTTAASSSTSLPGGGDDPSGTSAPAPSDPTASDRSDTSGSGGSGGSVPRVNAADCSALSQVVIPAAAIITAEDFIPVDQRTPDGGGPALEAVARVMAIVPAPQRAAWEEVLGAMSRAVDERRPLAPAERARLQQARNGSEVWARTACPDVPPSWQCDTFGSVGPGPDVAPTRAEAASPAAVLARGVDTGRAIELQRADGIVLYGWVTDLGFVTRTQQVERIGDGWATSRRHICHGDP